MELILRVRVKDTEDEEAVTDYYDLLGSVFLALVHLSAFGFDTPEAEYGIKRDEEDDTDAG